MSAEGVGARAAFDAVILAGGRGSRLGGIDKAAVEVDGARLLDRVVAAARGCGARRVVVVGPEREPAAASDKGAVPDRFGSSAPDVVAREDPPFGGPLPALAAGLTEVGAEWLMLLPCDLERPAELCAHLLAAWDAGRAAALDAPDLDAPDPDAPDRGAVPGGRPIDGVRLIDDDGRPQWLAGVYRADALRRGIAAALARSADPEPTAANRAAPPASAAGTAGEALAGLPLRVAFAGARITEAPAPSAVVADIDTPEDLARVRASERDAKSDGPLRHPS